ncbi:uncharacterized protein GGS22DRAFT_165241 [Annulohypoxylon maeteangense]|uniref:uncharacterized protein n=1 Tax=Annulohypoxylon maeteangense TaxID=1927788 RepID=UPI002007D7E9|nr:uncharacterized protein GGS22DRAFT_165241 [Annulohypoxylon maeteangense]KAI0884262.1 hypothetical protein GGS22DRAFT_165241 [Annulohypoxylon maeteangense]
MASFHQSEPQTWHLLVWATLRSAVAHSLLVTFGDNRKPRKSAAYDNLGREACRRRRRSHLTGVCSWNREDRTRMRQL